MKFLLLSMPGRGFGGFTSFKDRSVDLDSLCPIIGSSTADKRDLDELLNSFNIVELEEESEQQNLLNLQIHQMKMVWTKNYFLNKRRSFSKHFLLIHVIFLLRR